MAAPGLFTEVHGRNPRTERALYEAAARVTKRIRVLHPRSIIPDGLLRATTWSPMPADGFVRVYIFRGKDPNNSNSEV